MFSNIRFCLFSYRCITLF